VKRIGPRQQALSGIFLFKGLKNLCLVHLVFFDWLDRIIVHEAGDVRLRC
jgi:hypothetical protein